MQSRVKKLAIYLKKLLRGNERGVALIFTLGILGLLMVIALSFASTAMVDRKVAANVNNNQVAKMLAKSALERIEAGLTSGVSTEKIISGDHSSVNKKTFDWLWKMDTTDSGVEVYKLTNSYTPDSFHPTWQYVLASSGTDFEIIGRFAYVAVQDGGKLDPSVVTDTTTSPRYRPGINVSEMDIKNLDISDADYNNYDSALVAGLASLGIPRWADFTQLFLNVPSITDKNKFLSFFQIKNTPDPEAFWQDLNNDGVIDPAEVFHRFNMVRTDWNTVTLADICPAAASDSSVAKKYSEKLTDTNATGGIPWFKNWSSLDSADTFANVTNKRNQIVANFIQYCSPDTREVISDLTPGNWLANADISKPEYTGLKRTPYINEICADVEIKATVITTRDDRPTSGTADFEITYSALVKLGGELINMYGASLLGGTKPLYIFGDLEVVPVLNGADQPIKTLALNNAAAPFKALSFTLNGAGTYTPVTEITPLTFTDLTSNGGAYADLLTVTLLNQTVDPTTAARGTLKLYRAVLDTVDYAKIYKDTALVQGNTPVSYAVSYQTKDPRQNLNPGDWTDTVGASTKGFINTGANPVTGSPTEDAETATNPAYLGAGAGQHVSTAYIRHGTMKSPWELGAIHRGAAWQTLNLNRHALRPVSTNYKVTDGGGKYYHATDPYGDANILDQIKFTSSISTYGKVNLNSSIDGVLNALFAQLPYRADDVSTSESKYYNPGYSTTFTSQNQSATVASFKTLRGTFDSSIIKTRTEFLNNSAQFNDFIGKLYDNSTLPRVTDAQKEQLVSKFVNLTKAEKLDQVKVIILAQSIKEAQKGAVIFKDWNNTGIPAAPSTTIGNFNAGYIKYGETTPFASATTPYNITSVTGTYNNGADQITGECKMIVTLVRDSLGKWKIQRVEYAE